ncbi:thymidine phosphorylase [Pseudomonas sp. HAR-UPW-AIA-41]|uniref:DUF1631 domain-containing protein n=1 Tax=Pseudomonas sp. HAR-UPW-AIA-41 TaxID=1985301 RepID=UPI000BB35A4D|nr:DUF1631 domain-containing protein [Pseudomonas sp. HAR-UPW-AIA-41]PAV47636.1 thymidine phosphorylase [Pseudomonas sp. HAR-UPW-AIA-41]
MNEQDSKPNVVSLSSRIAQPRFGELLQSCRQLLLNHLAKQLDLVFAGVDDALFDCADKASSNSEQTLYFDSMREIRKQRVHLERAYHQWLGQKLSAFAEGKCQTVENEQVALDDLSLVQNDDYEESLQVTNMTSRVNARCAQPLFGLEQRLALLNNGLKPREEDNPFGPRLIAQAFRESLKNSPFPLSIRLTLYQLFDQYLMSSLDSLFAELNQKLIEAGLLPNLKYRPTQAPGRSNSPVTATAEHQTGTEPTGNSSPTQPSTTSTTPTSYSGFNPLGSNNAVPSTSTSPGYNPPGENSAQAGEQSPSQLFSDLSSLIAEHRQQAPHAPLFGGSRSIASYAPQGAHSTYSASELLSALNRLQQNSGQDLQSRLQQPQAVEGLKAELHEQLEAISQLPGQQKLADEEADVIDLVGMLFDFILDDDNLPDNCKTALSHLHTPYLKVALHDKALFTQHHHPARQLLNSMAQAGVLYGGEGDDRGLLAKMHWVVERVIHSFNGDLQLFDSLLEEFNEYVATLKHKVELRERRAVEAAKGRDKLLGARQQAVEAIEKCLNDRELPPLLKNFLELTWTDVLVFILLRGGERNGEWQKACEAAEQLAWSGTPLDEGGRAQLGQLRIGLLEELRKGLELLGGYHEDGIRRLLQDIVACQHAVQAKQPQLAAKLKPQLQESALGAMLGEDAELAKTPRPKGALSARAQSFIKELESLEFGTWFEFVNGDTTQTLKLSWFSPTTRNYMFVDHAGQRVAVKPISQLAEEMEQGKARLLPRERNAPLVDRALGAIYRALQRFTGRTPSTAH